jgi:tetratricopeptide (TPR) repeat protein
MTPEESRSAMLVEQAQELVEEGALGEARVLLEKQIRLDPNDFSPLDLEVDILFQQDEGALAQRLLEEYIRYHPQNADAAARLGWLLYKTEQIDEAMAELRATLARHPEHLKARLWLIEWLEQQTLYEEVITCCEKGFVYAPDQRDLLLYQGRAASKLKNPLKAKEAFHRLGKFFPNDEQAATAIAEHLTERNQCEEALNRLMPFVNEPDPDPATLYVYIKTSFRGRFYPHATRGMELLLSLPKVKDCLLLRKALQLVFQNMGAKGGREFLMHTIHQGIVSDQGLLEFLSLAFENNDGPIFPPIFYYISHNPLLYQKSMYHCLAEFTRYLPDAQVVSSWVGGYQPLIEQETLLWGGVGGWMAYHKQWQAAVAHLSRYQGREGVTQSMLLVLGEALEELEQYEQANRHYRKALELPTDQAEVKIRSRLAFNLAMEDMADMAGAGHIIAVDCSEKGKSKAGPLDLIRLYAVEALATLGYLNTTEEKQNLLRETLGQMKTLLSKSDKARAVHLIRLFQQKALRAISEGNRR